MPNGRGKDLRDADLRDADLERGSLFRADLTDAALTGADLRNSSLVHGVLIRANFSGAVLTGAVLTGADLSDADLSDADLSDAELFGIRSGRIKGTPINLPNNWTLRNGRLLWDSRGSRRDAKLRRVDLTGADHLTDADLIDANLRGARSFRANLQDTDLGAANLKRMMLDGVGAQNLGQAIHRQRPHWERTNWGNTNCLDGTMNNGIAPCSGDPLIPLITEI